VVVGYKGAVRYLPLVDLRVDPQNGTRTFLTEALDVHGAWSPSGERESRVPVDNIKGRIISRFSEESIHPWRKSVPKGEGGPERVEKKLNGTS